MTRVCNKLRMTRQNYYATRGRREARAADAELINHLVTRERESQPRVGGRKLMVMLDNEFREAGVRIGRDRFFDVLRAGSLLLEPLKAWIPRTTDSRHALPVFTNLVQDIETTGPNQVWVADLTYLRTRSGFLYLSLVMDRHSRKVVGWHCGDTLEAVGCVASLEMAMAALPAGAHPIHHSDRGCQYACHQYVRALTEHGLGISMTGEWHCYENAHAERLNGVLKQEYGLGMNFRNKKQALRAVAEAIMLYNNRRLHVALGYRTPESVHAA